MLKIFRGVNFLKFPRGGRGPQGGAVFLRKIPTAFARGPPGVQKHARNVRIPMLKIFGELTF